MSEYIITRDGRPTYGRYTSEDTARHELLFNRQGQSVDWAMKHEGWGILEVPAARWPDLEARELRAQARHLLTAHDRHGSSVLERVNCGACVLGGYQPSDKSLRTDGHNARKDGPNYAGWARIYVQAGKRIPSGWKDAFYAEVNDTDNESYAAGLRKDISTWAVNAPWLDTEVNA
jgi:hypothetical protein